MFELDLIFMLSCWRKTPHEGSRKISKPDKVIVVRRQK